MRKIGKNMKTVETNQLCHITALLFIAVLFVAATQGRLNATEVTFSSQASFLAAFSSSETFDFEPASGFPSDPGVGPNPFIGVFSGINFNAAVSVYPYPSSGVQVMTGYTGNQLQGGLASVDFSSLPKIPFGVGFFATDQNSATSIRLTTYYTGGSSSVFTITQPASVPNFTPFFFGVVNTSDTISRIELNGYALGSQEQIAWSIDDLSIGLVAVPEPHSLLLCTIALGLYALARGSRQQKH
jgi:hypothetical protein